MSCWSHIFTGKLSNHLKKEKKMVKLNSFNMSLPITPPVSMNVSDNHRLDFHQQDYIIEEGMERHRNRRIGEERDNNEIE